MRRHFTARATFWPTSSTIATRWAMLAIQTAKFDGSTISQIAEFVGWFFMLVSAIVGVWRVSYIGPLYSQYAEIRRKEAEGIRMEQALIAGLQTWDTTDGQRPIPEILAALKGGVE